MTDRINNERVLSRFRDWLDESHTEADQLASAESATGFQPAELQTVGLYHVIEEFTALRQELKLETKSARQLKDQIVDMLGSMQQAIEKFDTVNAKDDEAIHSSGKPLAEAISAIDEALDRGKSAIEDARKKVVSESVRKLRESLDVLYRAEPWWRRWACRRYYRRIQDLWFVQAETLNRKVFDSLVEGYGLIQCRLDRAMSELHIQRIPCAGQIFDPRSMTVIEVVDDPDRQPGFVVAEIRRGYLWRGRVLRFAEVRAVAQN